MGKSARQKSRDRWYHHKDETLRKDIHDALVALRQHAENAGSGKVMLVTTDTYQERQLCKVHTTRVQEWELGYGIKPLLTHHGFYMRSVFLRLHGGRLDEINSREQQQIIDAVCASVMDPGSPATVEFISPVSLVIRQPFAVTFWSEGNPNIVTPSARYLNRAFDPSRVPGPVKLVKKGGE